MKIETFKDLLELIQSDILTNDQVYFVVLKSMNLFLSEDEYSLPRNELANMLQTHFDKYFTLGYKIVPLFL